MSLVTEIKVNSITINSKEYCDDKECADVLEQLANDVEYDDDDDERIQGFLDAAPSGTEPALILVLTVVNLVVFEDGLDEYGQEVVETTLEDLKAFEEVGKDASDDDRRASQDRIEELEFMFAVREEFRDFKEEADEAVLGNLPFKEFSRDYPERRRRRVSVQRISEDKSLLRYYRERFDVAGQLVEEAPVGELAKIVMLGATTRYIPEAEWSADEASSDQL